MSHILSRLDRLTLQKKSCLAGMQTNSWCWWIGLELPDILSASFAYTSFAYTCVYVRALFVVQITPITSECSYLARLTIYSGLSWSCLMGIYCTLPAPNLIFWGWIKYQKQLKRLEIARLGCSPTPNSLLKPVKAEPSASWKKCGQKKWMEIT